MSHFLRTASLLCALLLLAGCSPKKPSPDGSNNSDGSDVSDVSGDVTDTPTSVTTGETNVDGNPTSTKTTSTGSATSASTKPTAVLHSILDLNLANQGKDFHAKDTGVSDLEFDFRNASSVEMQKLRVTTAVYPRIKRMDNGEYILFFQDGQIGWNIYYSKSKDLKEWSSSKKLFSSYKIKNNSDDRCFSTCDAIQLKNGTILAVCSFRSNAGYARDLKNDGLMMKTSTDNGVTWSEERVIYTGTNWEPQILQLDSGEVQVYFTHSAPKIVKEGIANSSGTAIIRSKDNGATWNPNVTESPYAAYRISQQYTGTDNKGNKIYTDQMPCAVQLNNGTIALAAESMFDNNHRFEVSMIYSADNWKKELGFDEEGPADKQKCLFTGAGPYLTQFPSGETVLSFNNNSKLLVRLGDSTARKFSSNAYSPLSSTGFWGTLELMNAHTVIASMHNNLKTNSGMDIHNIAIALGHLNHSVTAQKGGITLDGKNSDWKDDSCLFVGSKTQAQATVRYAADKDNLYVLAECLDNCLTSGDSMALYLSDGAANKLGENALRIEFTSKGIYNICRYRNNVWTPLKESTVRSAGFVNGTLGDNGDTDTGYFIELQIPRSLLASGTLTTVRTHLTLRNQDADGKSEEDLMGSIRVNNLSDWFTVKVG